MLTTLAKFQLHHRPEELKLFNYAVLAIDMVLKAHTARTVLAKLTK